MICKNIWNSYHRKESSLVYQEILEIDKPKTPHKNGQRI